MPSFMVRFFVSMAPLFSLSSSPPTIGRCLAGKHSRSGYLLFGQCSSIFGIVKQITLSLLLVWVCLYIGLKLGFTQSALG
ncbi:hypothetical protein L2E82_18588 [Cichorium intybus]|uniref:Uncharacterized protein n=1 Tax=Cichorium intybus TaxID=13427 RepID=A0ACB9FB74_CICIN|nr:hypothetical protein L2E82_18588 [Cichorium intybus]